jgi:hypothetical protein
MLLLKNAGFLLGDALARASESHAAQAAPLGGEATSPAAHAAQPARKSPQTSRPKDGTVSDVALVVWGARTRLLARHAIRFGKSASCATAFSLIEG